MSYKTKQAINNNLRDLSNIYDIRLAVIFYVWLITLLNLVLLEFTP